MEIIEGMVFGKKLEEKNQEKMKREAKEKVFEKVFTIGEIVIRGNGAYRGNAGHGVVVIDGVSLSVKEAQAFLDDWKRSPIEGMLELRPSSSSCGDNRIRYFLKRRVLDKEECIVFHEDSLGLASRKKVDRFKFKVNEMPLVEKYVQEVIDSIRKMDELPGRWGRVILGVEF